MNDNAFVAVDIRNTEVNFDVVLLIQVDVLRNRIAYAVDTAQIDIVRLGLAGEILGCAFAGNLGFLGDEVTRSWT